MGLIEEAGNARRQYRQVCIRLDGGAYAILARIAMRSRVSPTTMARILLRKALANAVSDPADRPLP
jgi:hypothetical protein